MGHNWNTPHIFWSSAEPELNTGCWLWSRPLTNRGYGRFTLQGRADQAHRISWRLTFGEIPPGLCVCHRCDTPACVNPAHLFLGTDADNAADRKSKGRTRGGDAKGADHPFARLTEAQVRDIRALAAARALSQREIASRFGLSQSHVSRLASGKSWA